jgi:hypothetical protein
MDREQTLLKIQKKRTGAVVVFADESRQEGNFFVSLKSSHRHGSESIAELLNGGRKYLPFELEDGQITIVQKNAIVMAYLKNKEFDDIAELSKKVFVQVTFISGSSVSGYIYQDLPSGYPRLSDYLNRAQRFFYLETDSSDCLLNSEFVRLVTPSSV